VFQPRTIDYAGCMSLLCENIHYAFCYLARYEVKLTKCHWTVLLWLVWIKIL